jgi:O-antigen ligase
MLLTFLVAIFIRPFVSSPAFPYLNFAFSLVFLIFLGAYFIYKKAYLLDPRSLFYPILLFIFALFISLVFSQDKINSSVQLYKYLTGLLLFFVVASLSKRERISVVRTITLAGLIISLLAIYQYFFGFKHLADYLANSKSLFPFVLDYLQSRRVFAPFVTPGILGGYLAMVIPLFFINKDRSWLFPVVFFALFLTRSLGAFLSLFFGLIVYFCLQGRFKKRAIFYLLGIFMFMVIIFILRSAPYRQHTQPFFSMIMRLNYWKDAFEIIKRHPLVGVGLGNFNLKFSRYAHNSYIQIWAEMGILGLCAFIWVIYTTLTTSLKNLTKSPNRSQDVYLFIAGIIFLIHNFLDFTFFLPEVVFIWWIILGLMVDPNREDALQP